MPGAAFCSSTPSSSAHARREQLLQEQRACEDAERSILLDAW
jgi:hypothetical protein